MPCPEADAACGRILEAEYTCGRCRCRGLGHRLVLHSRSGNKHHHVATACGDRGDSRLQKPAETMTEAGIHSSDRSGALPHSATAAGSPTPKSEAARTATAQPPPQNNYCCRRAWKWQWSSALRSATPPSAVDISERLSPSARERVSVAGLMPWTNVILPRNRIRPANREKLEYWNTPARARGTQPAGEEASFPISSPCSRRGRAAQRAGKEPIFGQIWPKVSRNQAAESLHGVA